MVALHPQPPLSDYLSAMQLANAEAAGAPSLARGPRLGNCSRRCSTSCIHAVVDPIAEAAARLGEAMLLSWYDRDRDFEAPQHVSECHADSAVPGYVDYALHRGAALKIDIEDGRFVFFYLAMNTA